MYAFDNDIYELHHFGVHSEQMHFDMLEQAPAAVMLPFQPPDPTMMLDKIPEQVVGMFEHLLIPTVMGVFDDAAIKENLDWLEEELREDWHAYPSLIGDPFNPVAMFNGWYGEEQELAVMRVWACYPISVDEAMEIEQAICEMWRGSPYPDLERWVMLADEFGSTEKALAEACAIDLNAEIKPNRREALRLQQEAAFDAAQELEEYGSMLWDEHGNPTFTARDFMPELSDELATKWRRLLARRKLALQQMRNRLGGNHSYELERQYYLWP